MNNVPEKLKRKWREEDLLGIERVCMRAEEGDCAGRVTKEHALYFAGKQVQEEWAILDICAYHHEVDNFQDGGGMNKEKHTWIALSRAPEERLVALSKCVNQTALLNRLNKKYGIYKYKLSSLENY